MATNEKHTQKYTARKLFEEPSGLINWLVEYPDGSRALVSNVPFKDELTPLQRELIAANEDADEGS